MESEIFLSYSRADHSLAEQFVRTAETRGLNIWFDDKIEGGENWRQKIVDVLSSAKALVILFSEHSNGSTQLIKELAVADNMKKHVIPVLIADCKPEREYLYELASRNWINIYPNPETRLALLVDKLVTDLKLPGGGPSAAPVSAATLAPTPREVPASTRRRRGPRAGRAPLAAPVGTATVAPALVSTETAASAPVTAATDAPAPRQASSPPVGVAGLARATPAAGDDESWFPLRRFDLYLFVPIMAVVYLMALFGGYIAGSVGFILGIIAAFIYMVIISIRNAKLNRGVFSGRSFAATFGLLAIGIVPSLLMRHTIPLDAFMVLLIGALLLAAIANVAQAVLRKVFQLQIFDSRVQEPLGG
jgi:TIR domain